LTRREAPRGPVGVGSTRGGDDGLTMRSEIIRKAIHVTSVTLPLLVWILPREHGLILLGSGLLAALIVEWARSQVRWARYHFLARTRHLLRSRERKGVSGATYMVLAYFLVLLVLPKSLAIVAMLYGAFGDASAALVGKRWGRHRTRWGKSFEGYAAGFVVNVAVGFVVPEVPPAAAIIGGLGAATFEFLPLPFDDNVRVTLGGGLAAWAGLLLAGAG